VGEKMNKLKFDFCPCDTCIYEGEDLEQGCELGHKEPFTSRKKECCPDWDEGETEE